MSAGEWVGALILVIGFYLFLREFFVRDADPLFDSAKAGQWLGYPGNGRLRGWRGPLYWLTWVIKQW